MMRPIAKLSLAVFLTVAVSVSLACTPGQGAESPANRSSAPSPSPSPTAIPFQPADFIEAAHQQMSRLTSFRVQTTDDYGYGFDYDRIIEFAFPDSYHVTEFVGSGSFDATIEFIHTGGTAYSRVCFDEEGEQECDSWWPREVSAAEMYVTAAGEYGHPWLVAALGLLRDPELIEDDDPDTRSLIHIRGLINPLAAQYEAEGEALGSWGTGPNDLPCYPPDRYSDDTDCREFDLEALTSTGRYRSLEALPPYLDLWFTPGSSNVKIYSIRVGETGHQPTTWRYDYLDHGGVTIQPPDPADIVDPFDF